MRVAYGSSASSCFSCFMAPEETPVHSKLLLHYCRRLTARQGALPPPDLPQLVSTEALLLVSRRRLHRQRCRCCW